MGGRRRRRLVRVEAIAHAFPHVPLLFNWAEGGKTPPVDRHHLQAWGFRLAIFPISTLLAATRAIREVLAQIQRVGTPLTVIEQLPHLNEFLDLIGLPEIRELEQRFGGAGGAGMERGAVREGVS